MAWRNVFRNKRRSLITAASVMFAVFFASSMRCLQEGAWGYLVDNIVGFYTGYAQVQDTRYQDQPSLNHAFRWKEFQDSLDVHGINRDRFVPRIQNFALASHDQKSKAVLVIGSPLEQEDKLTRLSEKLTPGSALPKAGEMLVAKGVADRLNVAMGDSLVILSQGRHGASAVGLFRISGFAEYGSPEMNEQFVFLPLSDADYLFDMKGNITSAVALMDKEKELESLRAKVAPAVPAKTHFLDYEELLPEILQAREFDKLAGRVIIGVLYLLIGFGIFGTILMMLKERQYEFGILKAIGLKTHQLYFVILLEGILIALGGAIAGMIFAVPVIWYFQEYPIEFTGEYAEVYQSFGLEAKIPFLLDFGILATQGLIIAILTVFLTIYAYFQIKKLRAVEAMKA